MSNEIGSRVRYGECVWPAHHEAWQQSALNQREYWSMRHTGFRCKLSATGEPSSKPSRSAAATGPQTAPPARSAKSYP